MTSQNLGQAIGFRCLCGPRPGCLRGCQKRTAQ